MINVVIFDFDGTIAETLDSILTLFNEIAPNYSLPTIKDADKEKIRNSSARELLKEYKLSPLKLFQLARTIRSKLKKNMQDISIVEGMPEMFLALRKRNVEIGIVTSNSKENVEVFLKNQNVKQVNFIHSEKGLFGKGKVLTHLIRQRKLNKQEVVYVGDEVRDVEAARRADISVIAVTWGFNSEERLKQSKPDFLIAKPEQIIKIVKAQQGLNICMTL